MRHAAIRKRRDENERAIIDALQKAGADVWQLSGEGLPDLLIRRHRQVWGLEVKSRQGRRTPAQQVTGWPIVRDEYEALAEIGAL